jgi:hypothetical protein
MSKSGLFLSSSPLKTLHLYITSPCVLHAHPISKSPPHKEGISNPAALITSRGAPPRLNNRVPLVSEVTPTSQTGNQNTAFCQKNGIQSERTHNKFYYSVGLGAPRAAGSAGTLYTPLGHTLLSSNKNIQNKLESYLHSPPHFTS